MRRTRFPWWLAVLLALAFAACTDAPDTRYTQAVAAAEQQNVTLFRTFFTRQSAELLRGLEVAGKRSRLYYIKDPLKLLPKGDLDNVLVQDNFAVLTFKVRGAKQDVWMYLEDGQWKIDLTSLPEFWAALDNP